MDHTEIIGKIIRLRKKLGLKQKEFAPIIGVESNTLSRWENNKNVPLPMALKRMEEILRSGPKKQEEKKGFGRLDVLLRFMRKRREERSSDTGEKNK